MIDRSLRAAGEHCSRCGRAFTEDTPVRRTAAGTWVHDTHNDWNEIHPVWTVQYNSRGGAITSLPPRTPEYTCSGND